MVLEQEMQPEIPKKFQSPEEELVFLRERVKQKESEIGVPDDDFENKRIAHREVREYQDTPTADVLHDTYREPESNILKKVLELEPEEHDTQVDELLTMVSERGIKNTLAVVDKMGSAHLEDDLHRALVQYIARGLPSNGVSKSSEVWRALNMVLYEVSISEQDTDADLSKQQQYHKDLSKLLASMEQFYLGILAMSSGSKEARKNIFSLEMAVEQGSESVVFYVSVPRDKKNLFEKHIVSIFANAKIEERRGDYNIFTYGGSHVGAYAEFTRHPVYPLKLYDEFTHDPMNVILSAFSKLDKHNEGAAIQFVIGNEGTKYNDQYKKIIDKVRKGYKIKKAVWRGSSTFNNAMGKLGDALKDAILNIKQKNDNPADQIVMDIMTKKVNSRIVPANLRIITSAKEEDRAQEILSNLASTFNQLEEAQGNALKFVQQRGRKWRRFMKNFVFRQIDIGRTQLFSIGELTTMYHLTATAISGSRELKKSRSKGRSAPIEVSEANESGEEATASGVVLGKNIFGGSETQVRFKPKDRLRHFYEIGQTGTGKTYLMKNMIIQDMQNGDGCCYIDPHGSDIIDVLANVPRERWDDVIYFDPAYIPRPMGLNMYEYDPNAPEQKTFVVDEMFSIFEKLFGDMPESMGPMFQQYFRNASLLIVDDPHNPGTLADVPRVMADKKFRDKKLAETTNPLVKQFWKSAEATSGEHSLENFVPYITSKTDIFLANEFIRPIVAQQRSAFDFSDVMNNRKILLVNLAKGRLGEMNSNLLGLIIVGKFLQAAFARVNLPESQRHPFYLYIDEFQNFTTPSISTILSEARKYQLSLNIAHQYIAQLNEKIRDSVFGNVGTKCIFRVGSEDGEFLEKALQPDVNALDVTTLENYNAYLSLLVDGTPMRPFNIQTLENTQKPNYDQVEILKKMSYERYGRPREEVEQEIKEKYMEKTLKEQPLPDSLGMAGF